MIAHHDVLVDAVSRSLIRRGPQPAAIEVDHRVLRDNHRASMHYLLLPLHRSTSTKHFRLRRSSQLLALTPRIRPCRFLGELTSALLDEDLWLPINLLQCLCLNSTRVIIRISTILH